LSDNTKNFILASCFILLFISSFFSDKYFISSGSYKEISMVFGCSYLLWHSYSNFSNSVIRTNVAFRSSLYYNSFSTIFGSSFTKFCSVTWISDWSVD
jgi:hypothetical protein